MKISFMQSGGFAGVIRGCVIDVADLAADERHELESLVAACGAEASASASAAGRDLRQYDIVIEQDGAPRFMRCDERSMPEASRPLIAFLAARARPQPPGFADAFDTFTAGG